MKNAKTLLLLLIALLIGFTIRPFLTRQKSDTMPKIKKTNRALDEEQIRKTEAAYDYAWQQGNIDALMSCFTDDAVLISPRGDRAFGKKQIRNLLSNFINSEAKNTKHTGRIILVSFVTDDVAVADGEATIAGGENLSSTDTNHGFSDILVRRGDRWLINQIRAYKK